MGVRRGNERNRAGDGQWRARSCSALLGRGIEYYGALGPVTGFDPVSQQQQQIIPAIDLNLSEKWKFNFGVDVGVTRSTDHLLAKMILGYRFDF